jgi:LruC domain-containing protein
LKYFKKYILFITTLIVLVVQSRASIVTSGLIARYDAANASSYGGTGNRLNNLANTGFATLFNNPTYNASGNPFLSFNGVNQHFVTENLTNFFPGAIGSKTNAISVFLWVYPTDAGVLVSEQGTASIDNFWYTSFIEITNVIGNSGTINCGTWSSAGIQFVSTGITLNQWNLIGLTHTGTTLTGYLNGVSFGTRNYARWSPFNHDANEFLTFGSGTTTNMGNGTYSNARFGQMGVYNRAISAAEMLQNYEAIVSPTLAASNLTFGTTSSSSFVANWTNGNGQGRLIVCRPSSASASSPVVNTNYTANASYGNGTAIGSGFVVGAGNISTLTVTNLQANTNYCLDIFEYNGSVSSSNAFFLRSTFLQGCRTTLFPLPTIASASFTTNTLTSSSWAGNWVSGNGTARLVVCRPGSSSVTLPTNNTNYTASLTYGSGSVLGSGFVVGAGSISSIAIANLQANTNYCIDIFEYNGNISGASAQFLSSTYLNICNTTLSLAPTAGSTNLSFSSITNAGFTGSFTGGNGVGRLVICRPSAASLTAPTNLINYSANSSYELGTKIGNGYVVGLGSISTLSISNLVSNTSYCLDVFEYNGSLSNNTAVFNTSSVLSACQKTNMVYPTIPATAFRVTQNNPTALSVAFTNGNGTKRIVLVSAGTAPSSFPIDATTYSANTTFQLGAALGNAYVAFNQTGSSFTLSNLNPNTLYYFRIIEYTENGSDPAYANGISLLDSATTNPADTDSDGVIDLEDMYPNDSLRAFATSYPAGGFGTLLFEDLWPSVGDYDFNDLVIDYQYTIVSNAENNAVEARYTFVTRAIGGALHNGFAFQMNGLNPNKIFSTSGTKTNGITWATLNANGTEVGNNSAANIPVFKDAYDLLPGTGGHWFMNVEPNAPDVGTDTTIVLITFLNNGLAPAGGVTDASVLSSVNFNPYIIVGQERGKEIHLVNMPPSQLMNMSYFGSLNDGSVPSSNIYFKSKQGLPWALNINQSIPYPSEKIDFITAFPNFVNWAQSGGATHADWYLNNPGNRVLDKLIIR